MSLFRRDSQHDPNPAVADPRRPAPSNAPSTSAPSAGAAPAGASSLIAKGTKVKGQITGGTEVVIDGELDGEIQSDHLVTVGPGGRVKGKITARAARVQGRVTGDVRGTERVELEATATLEGDISAPRVTIAEGAFFKGTVEMTGSGGAKNSGSGAKKPSSSGPGQQAAAVGSDRRDRRDGRSTGPGQPSEAGAVSGGSAKGGRPK